MSSRTGKSDNIIVITAYLTLLTTSCANVAGITFPLLVTYLHRLPRSHSRTRLIVISSFSVLFQILSFWASWEYFILHRRPRWQLQEKYVNPNGTNMLLILCGFVCVAGIFAEAHDHQKQLLRLSAIGFGTNGVFCILALVFKTWNWMEYNSMDNYEPFCVRNRAESNEKNVAQEEDADDSLARAYERSKKPFAGTTSVAMPAKPQFAHVKDEHSSLHKVRGSGPGTVIDPPPAAHTSNLAVSYGGSRIRVESWSYLIRTALFKCILIPYTILIPFIISTHGVEAGIGRTCHHVG
jgi:hypothetical protein